MAYSGVQKDVARAVSLERPERLPVFLCSEEMDVRIAGSRYDRYNSDSRELVRVQAEAVERFDYDWAWLQVDDCLEFEPLGVETRGGGDILPATCGYLDASAECVKHLAARGYRVEGRMGVLLEAIAGLKARFGDRVVICGRTAAPFSSVTLAFGITETLTLLYEEPEFVQSALSFFEEYQTRFGLDQIEAGADAIWLGDCNASGHIISPEHYGEFAGSGASRVSAAYREAGGTVIYHASEEQPRLIELQADRGFSVLSVGPGVDIASARDITEGRVCLAGNVDPIGVLARGTPQDVERSVRDTIASVSSRGGHLLNTGEMVPRETPEANVRAFVESARSAWEELTRPG